MKRSKVRRLVVVASLMLVFILTGFSSAQGSLLRLSDYASDGSSPPSAEDLDALLDLSINIDGRLELAVTNLTPEDPQTDPALNINEVYFNARDNVTALSLFDVVGSNLNQWDFGFLQGGGNDGPGNPYQVNGFGKFDAYLVDGQGKVPHVIEPGETVTFILDVTGTGPILDTDFIELSTQVDGHIISYAAAKFYNGEPEVSAYGATNVPEPATVMLLGLGGLALLRKRRARA